MSTAIRSSSSRPRRRRRGWATRLAALAALATVAGLLPVIAPAPAAAADPPSTYRFNGRGYGHGRGAGQYGALGYALDHGWSSARILDHYYGGTRAGSVAAGSPISVRLLGHDAQPLTAVTSSTDVVAITDAGRLITVPDRYARTEVIGAGRYRVSTGPTCSGPFTTVVSDVAANWIRTVPAHVDPPEKAAYGRADDLPVVGDWNGDGDDGLGLFRPSTRMFYIRNDRRTGNAQLTFAYGRPGDIPLVGDWDDDGDDDVGVFRDGHFLLKFGTGPGGADLDVQYGRPGDFPIVGDWDGDGRTGIGVRRGNRWLLRNTASSGGAEIDFLYGLASDQPLVGDWDGGGTETPGIRRGQTFHLRNSNTGGGADDSYAFGTAGGRSFSVSRSRTGRDTVGVRAGIVFEIATSSGPAVELLQGSYLPLEQTLQLCKGTSPDRTWYRGTLRLDQFSGSGRTVNDVDLDAYLRGVVPSEMPASWGSLGCAGSTCRGAQALQVQAVAARSYSWSEARYPYAKTCDTTACQVYLGRQSSASGRVTVHEKSLTDAAIAGTAGLIRQFADGRPARTEFSSSTGGYTSTGTFPGIRDHGDSVAANPNKAWSVDVPRTTLEQRFGLGKGTLRDADVIARTPADLFRRAATVRFRFDGGIVDVSGEAVRSVLGLRSSLFSIESDVPSGLGVRRDQVWYQRDAPTTGPSSRAFAFGAATDVPVMGDWNGDGIDSPGVFRAGVWFLRNSNSTGGADATFAFGPGGGQPVVGDWDGDGDDNVGVFDSGTWYLRTANADGVADLRFVYGPASALAVAGDWNGDGKDDPAVLAGTSWTLRASRTAGPGEETVIVPAGIPFAGDFDGDGIDQPGTFADGYLRWLKAPVQGVPTLVTEAFGTAGDVPVIGRTSPVAG